MILLDRDRQIVLSVGRFGQLAAGHIRTMHFEGSSDTPMYRALARLVEQKFLSRLERRMIGGTGAGSGQFVFQLGRKGWALCGKEGTYWPFRAVKLHTMAIADAYTALLDYQKRGRIRIESFDAEPESHRKVGNVIVRPDLFVDIADLGKRRNLAFWVEIDMGTERQAQITEKLTSYVAAMNAAESFVPYVLFIAPDDERAAKLRYWIKQHGEGDSELFLVSTASAFAPLIFG
ncbi:replication-relaxation family protein [Rathayibacter sp. AY1C5]|uniref:replication-relaxation family protein n=1 Tax=Rathayibacter sp. AY1C5 TaxID=2080538 RepID=UPI0015E429E4|nr:replication-relaxation family protein [Rathayibacter sp. AY1C5]